MSAPGWLLAGAGFTLAVLGIRAWRRAGRTLDAIVAGEVQDGEPDLAEAEELATLLHATREQGVRGSAGSVPGEWDRRDARAILAAGYKREDPK